MLLVSGEEDHRGQLPLWQGSQNVKPVDAGHLHIKKHNIGSEFQNFLDRRRTVAALPDDLDILESLQPQCDPAPRQRFIVDDQCPHATPSTSKATVRNGSSRITSHPPTSGECSENRWFSP